MMDDKKLEEGFEKWFLSQPKEIIDAVPSEVMNVMKMFAKGGYAQGLMDGAGMIIERVTGLKGDDFIKTYKPKSDVQKEG